jgi:hypothetical protein
MGYELRTADRTAHNADLATVYMQVRALDPDGRRVPGERRQRPVRGVGQRAWEARWSACLIGCEDVRHATRPRIPTGTVLASRMRTRSSAKPPLASGPSGTRGLLAVPADRPRYLGTATSPPRLSAARARGAASSPADAAGAPVSSPLPRPRRVAECGRRQVRGGGRETRVLQVQPAVTASTARAQDPRY